MYVCITYNLFCDYIHKFREREKMTEPLGPYFLEKVISNEIETNAHRNIEGDFYFLRVHLGDSNRQPQSSQDLECYP